MRLTSGNLQELHRTAERPALSTGWTSALIVIALFLVFLLDRATGSAPVQHLYYLPIILGAFKFGKRGGLVAAVAAIILYHLANAQLLKYQYEPSDVLQITLFIAVGIVTAKLTADARRLRLLAMTDDLTGLHNLRSFEARLVGMVQEARERKAPLSLLTLDLDRLKSLNDQFGHLAGAQAVRIVGQIIAANLPPDAVACRYGGDEFVIALPNCGEPQANETGRNMCQTVKAAAPVLADHRFPAATLSISVGLACSSLDPGMFESPLTSEEEAGEALFRAADRALYTAKASGGNCVRSA